MQEDHSRTIRATIVKKYEGAKENLRKDIETVSSVLLPIDTWTSTAIDSYITVTEHHITDDKSYARETQWGLNFFLQDCKSAF